MKVGVRGFPATWDITQRRAERARRRFNRLRRMGLSGYMIERLGPERLLVVCGNRSKGIMRLQFVRGDTVAITMWPVRHLPPIFIGRSRPGPVVAAV